MTSPTITIDSLFEDYHDKPHEYSAGCPYAWKDQNWDYCECGLKEAVQALKSAVLEVIPDEKVGTDKIPLNSAEHGYNIAIQDVSKALTTLMGGE
ncbi:MAG: hypothetical protein QFB87_04670 [Patescibacteria group bacterium]|nr:hypothetical protein [Patescibacteria group bacterium]